MHELQHTPQQIGPADSGANAHRFEIIYMHYSYSTTLGGRRSSEHSLILVSYKLAAGNSCEAQVPH